MARILWTAARDLLTTNLAALTDGTPAHAAASHALRDLIVHGEAYDRLYDRRLAQMDREGAVLSTGGRWYSTRTMAVWTPILTAAWDRANGICCYLERKQRTAQTPSLAPALGIIKDGQGILLTERVMPLPSILTEHPSARASVVLNDSMGTPMLRVSARAPGEDFNGIEVEIVPEPGGYVDQFNLKVSAGSGLARYTETYGPLRLLRDRPTLGDQGDSLLIGDIEQLGVGRPADTVSPAVLSGGVGGIYQAMLDRMDRLTNLPGSTRAAVVTSTEIALLNSTRDDLIEAWTRRPPFDTDLTEYNARFEPYLAAANDLNAFLASGFSR